MNGKGGRSMTWNEYLYLFWKKHGGNLFAIYDKEWDGTLLLEEEKGTVLIRTEETGTSRSGTSFYHIIVSTQVKLERPYCLQITPANLMWNGINQVLGGLQQGAKRLGLHSQFYHDYQTPMSLGNRHITTSDPTFTKWVLQSEQFCSMLKEKAKWGVRVGPTGKGERVHTVSVYESEDNYGLDYFEPLLENGETQEAMMRYYERKGFDATLNQLIDFVKEASASVTAWPMPMISPNG